MTCFNPFVASPVECDGKKIPQYFLGCLDLLSQEGRFNGSAVSPDFPLSIETSSSFFKIYQPDLMYLPCRQCLGCRLERSSEYGIRTEHELRYHDESCFITLTYSPEHLPSTGSLVHYDYQTFI